MSAFDDEFGLFSDEEVVKEEDERRSTLGARQISTGETIIDEIEPEDDRPRHQRGKRSGPESRPFDPSQPRRRPTGPPRAPLADDVAFPRATDLLEFLAKRLVGKPDAVAVSLHPDDRGAVLELEVDRDDLGKVIGRGGRVAQALRTLIRAGAEGRVTVDIVDVDDDEDDEEDVAAGETETPA